MSLDASRKVEGFGRPPWEHPWGQDERFPWLSPTFYVRGPAASALATRVELCVNISALDGDTRARLNGRQVDALSALDGAEDRATMQRGITGLLGVMIEVEALPLDDD